MLFIHKLVIVKNAVPYDDKIVIRLHIIVAHWPVILCFTVAGCDKPKMGSLGQFIFVFYFLIYSFYCHMLHSA